MIMAMTPKTAPAPMMPPAIAPVLAACFWMKSSELVEFPAEKKDMDELWEDCDELVGEDVGEDELELLELWIDEEDEEDEEEEEEEEVLVEDGVVDVVGDWVVVVGAVVVAFVTAAEVVVAAAAVEVGVSPTILATPAVTSLNREPKNPRLSISVSSAWAVKAWGAAEALIDPKTHTKARGMTFGNILRTGPLLSQRKWRLRERGGKRGGLEREQSESQG